MLSQLCLQIQYNGLTLDVDGRTTKKLITHLKPHTFYNFVLTNRGSSLGGLQQTVTARTAFNMLSGKPSVAPKPDNDGFIVVYLPDGQSPVTVQYANPPPPIPVPVAVNPLCDCIEPHIPSVTPFAHLLR